MRRRDLLTLVAGATTFGPLVARAQQKRVPVIGYLTATMPVAALVDQFRKGLAEQGYVEGQNLAIEFRAAEGDYDRLAPLAAELVAHRVAVIVAAPNTFGIAPAKAATSSIPIVFLSGPDPVRTGRSHRISKSIRAGDLCRRPAQTRLDRWPEPSA